MKDGHLSNRFLGRNELSIYMGLSIVDYARQYRVYCCNSKLHSFIIKFHNSNIGKIWKSPKMINVVVRKLYLSQSLLTSETVHPIFKHLETEYSFVNIDGTTQ